MAKVLNSQDNVKIYTDLAEKYIKSGDFLKSLGFSFRAYECKRDYKLILDIARTYADMGLYGLSNKYLFIYLDIAPKSDHGICYEELGINFFYLENLWASQYYFNEKVQCDGFINIESLDKEVADFLADTDKKNNGYFVAYPFEKADYSYRLKAGKRALLFGDYNASAYIYASIPKECRSEDEDGELAVSYFLSGQDDKMLKLCHESIERHGENVTAYCNLVNYYRDKKDKEKCEYYYKKALQSRKGDEDEPYKIATCALELCDNITAKECLDIILKERVYDDTMLFFRGIANYNLGLYNEAEEDFKRAYMIDSTDIIYSFYVDLSSRKVKGEKVPDYSPFKFIKDLPDKVVSKYKQVLKNTISGVPPKKLDLDGLFDILKWGIKYGNENTQKECFFILSALRGDKSFNFLKEVLISQDIREEIKSIALMTLITNGCKDKIGIVTGPFFVKEKPKKLLCDNRVDGELFNASYAVCFAKCVFSGIKELDKVANATNMLYSKHKKMILENSLKADEVATLIMCSAGIKKLKNDKDVCAFYHVDYKKMKGYLDIIKGEKDDKGN